MERYITVSTLNRYLKHKFDTDPNIQILNLKGEISNFKGHTRGHLYFTLKDETSRINAVMFQTNASTLNFVPTDGMKVLVTGRFEELKKKLKEEGLFNQEHKKPIPKFPEKIGIITAPTGAAIRDILSTIKRRFPTVETILFPSLVQGELASQNIVEQIKKADTYNLDLLIVGRGGGSIEDLWSFNEEIVARAIYNANTPIISAVGHEIDFTISDFVADLRAPTPTGAAEMAVPNMKDVKNFINQLNLRLNKDMSNILNINIKKLENYKSNYVLTNPLATFEIREQKLDNLINKLNTNIKYILDKNIRLFNNIKQSHVLNNPDTFITQYNNTYELLLNKLTLLNPLNILSKGYSIVKKDGKVVKLKKDIKINDTINIKLYKGEIEAIVKEIK